jgi:dimeric dUTPase (all-alpha-NTP-PPase superfamily)
VISAIFARQRELEIKYSPIETKNGFYYPPMDPHPHIDDAQFQHWIKGMFWRVHEEVSEALEEPIDLVKWRERWETDPAVRHVFEELADALHFLTAVTLPFINPFTIKMTLPLTYWLRGTRANLCEDCADFCFQIGLAANALKNKPWKVTQMPTDEAKFKELLLESWRKFWVIWYSLGCKLPDIYQLYHKKNLVNQFRQESRY